jgi:uncharacterized protein (TIGR02147 family)
VSRLYQTTDYRRAITAELDARQLLRRNLAHVLQRSEGWLSLMLKGERHLDPELVAEVCRFLGLDDEESAYLTALVEFHNRSPKARQAAWATIHAIQRLQSPARLTEDAAQLYASWYTAAIAELARCDGFRADPAWIARTLHPPITALQAEEALTRLVRLGILVPDDAGSLRQSGEQTVSPSELPSGPISQALVHFHDDILQLAGQAIRAARHNERHYAGVVLAIPEQQYQDVLAKLREIEWQIVQAASEAKGLPNRLYIASLQLFPVSHYTDTEEIPS